MSRNKGTKLVSYLLACSHVAQNIGIIKFRTFEVCMLSLYTYVRLQFVYTFCLQLLTIKQYTCLCHTCMFCNLYVRIFPSRRVPIFKGVFSWPVQFYQNQFCVIRSYFGHFLLFRTFIAVMNKSILLLFIGLCVYYAMLVIYQQCSVARAHDDIIFLLQRRRKSA